MLTKISGSNPVNLVTQYEPSQNPDPIEVYIGECFQWLKQRTNDSSLVEGIFQLLAQRHFDKHLNQLLPLVQELVNRGANFKEKLVSLNGLSCQQIAFLYLVKLDEENHPESRKAASFLFALVGQDMNDVSDCLSVSYLEQVSRLLRSNQCSPSQVINGQTLMQIVFQNLVAGHYEGRLHLVPELILALLHGRGDPNLQFSSIEVRNRCSYRNPTCLHLLYLYWRSLKSRKSVEARWMRKAFLHLLNDPRIDVRTKFSTELLYPVGRKNNPSRLFWVKHFEEVTLAHYALACGDFETCKKILSLAPDLIDSTCSTTEGISTSLTPLNLTKYQGISLYHIAARRLHLVACTFLASVNGISDPEQRSLIMEYANLLRENITGQISPKTQKKIKQVFSVLKKVKPLPSQLPKAFYPLHYNGYDALYDPRLKGSIVMEVLYEQALVRRVDSKIHQGYRQDPDIPRINRASVEDFKTVDDDLGHRRPRADAVSSEQSLYDTGYLTNIGAQDPVLNNGLWKIIENYVRELAKNYYLCVHVYTGGVFTSTQDVKGPKTVTYTVFGQGEVSRPTHLFKVVFGFQYNTGWSSFALLVPNGPEPSNADLRRYCVPVQRIQELTGMDFMGKYSSNQL